MWSSLLSFPMPVHPGAHNTHRPHRSLDLGPPEPSARRLSTLPLLTAAIERRDRLGGLIHEYNLAA